MSRCRVGPNLRWCRGCAVYCWCFLSGIVTLRTYAATEKRRPPHRWVSILLGAFGVLAFLLSVVSPDDDSLQHEFVRGGALFRTAGRFSGTLSAKGPSVKISAVASLLAPPDLKRPRNIAGRIFFSILLPQAGLQPNPSGNRSPPLAT
jgi:hypothetical protein